MYHVSGCVRRLAYGVFIQLNTGIVLGKQDAGN